VSQAALEAALYTSKAWQWSRAFFLAVWNKVWAFSAFWAFWPCDSLLCDIQCHPVPQPGDRYIVKAVQASGRRVATGMGGVRLWGAWRPRNRGLSPKAKEFAQHLHNILESIWKNVYRKQPILDPFGRQGCFWCVPFISRMSWLSASIEHVNQGL
jgi:hypothetical protein